MGPMLHLLGRPRLLRPDGNVLVLKSFKLNDVSLTLDALSDRDIVARFAARREQLTNRVH